MPYATYFYQKEPKNNNTLKLSGSFKVQSLLCVHCIVLSIQIMKPLKYDAEPSDALLFKLLKHKNTGMYIFLLDIIMRLNLYSASHSEHL